ncbi:MAG: sigma-54-dependent Fis family transcriptional regulator [Bdellovibrionales bacterium]|nr:sigma-54-dependent Fis family transcriptional regulator [Bdellovibrionales bacterium]
MQGSFSCTAVSPVSSYGQAPSLTTFDEPSALQSRRMPRQGSFSGIISQCPRMKSVFSVLEKVARTDTTVLVLGESGTGKELIARALHSLSGRKGKIVPVNCGAIPEEILESELFGHEKGAFTGATASKVGRFQLADGGTIFLDEIGEMSPKLQVKLLRVLQDHIIEPVGSTRSIPVNVRIVAATNKDLRKEVEAGRFREDLFYRLQVVPIELPALRERDGDTALLAHYFLEREAEKLGRGPLRFTTDALTRLAGFEWPGNIRELENLVRRLAVLSDGGLIDTPDLPEYVRGDESIATAQATEIFELPAGGLNFNEVVDSFETNLILKALDRTDWNKKAAAQLLNLNRTTLVEKIKKKGLEKLRKEDSLRDEPVRPDFSAIAE